MIPFETDNPREQSQSPASTRPPPPKLEPPSTNHLGLRRSVPNEDSRGKNSKSPVIILPSIIPSSRSYTPSPAPSVHPNSFGRPSATPSSHPFGLALSASQYLSCPALAPGPDFENPVYQTPPYATTWALSNPNTGYPVYQPPLYGSAWTPSNPNTGYPVYRAPPYETPQAPSNSNTGNAVYQDIPYKKHLQGSRPHRFETSTSSKTQSSQFGKPNHNTSFQMQVPSPIVQSLIPSEISETTLSNRHREKHQEATKHIRELYDILQKDVSLRSPEAQKIKQKLDNIDTQILNMNINGGLYLGLGQIRRETFISIWKSFLTPACGWPGHLTKAQISEFYLSGKLALKDFCEEYDYPCGWACVPPC
ncbi:uncharacterized protein N7469_009746 [Penicillium citrinum]|uniref:Uncharacterized protein n=1 Tax=Penicillium citrinum TaxID=5077 RepID=A0A9W9NIZ9_PENCI|nr:uncharacterized protein N7469_009746 [Penicillium citrinum]KAJ5220859.1 hypothetical protein N7469_009746 [Penicillium citrinum]